MEKKIKFLFFLLVNAYNHKKTFIAKEPLLPSKTLL